MYRHKKSQACTHAYLYVYVQTHAHVHRHTHTHMCVLTFICIQHEKSNWNFMGSNLTSHSTYHTRWEHVVQIFQKGLIFDLLVSEDEGDTLALLSGRAVQELEVFQQVGGVVGSAAQSQAIQIINAILDSNALITLSKRRSATTPSLNY